MVDSQLTLPRFLTRPPGTSARVPRFIHPRRNRVAPTLEEGLDRAFARGLGRRHNLLCHIPAAISQDFDARDWGAPVIADLGEPIPAMRTTFRRRGAHRDTRRILQGLRRAYPVPPEVLFLSPRARRCIAGVARTGSLFDTVVHGKRCCYSTASIQRRTRRACFRARSNSRLVSRSLIAARLS